MSPRIKNCRTPTGAVIVRPNGSMRQSMKKEQPQNAARLKAVLAG
ncbi:hypothetical protein P4H83_06550 [Paenibacillus favisporus]|nr:hypothetical protein [Paenibacillus favisporus]MEC0174529.1 hypothetical protein [Paenibacillus favisporus]